MSKITRTVWGRQMAFCFRCGYSTFHWPTDRLETHEICGGVNRQKALKEPACWIRLCPDCHREVQGWSKEKQYALKMKFDEECANVDAFLAIWRPKATAQFRAEFAAVVGAIKEKI